MTAASWWQNLIGVIRNRFSAIGKPSTVKPPRNANIQDDNAPILTHADIGIKRYIIYYYYESCLNFPHPSPSFRSCSRFGVGERFTLSRNGSPPCIHICMHFYESIHARTYFLHTRIHSRSFKGRVTPCAECSTRTPGHNSQRR